MKLDLPHILIVDDDKRILQLINDYLIKNNFRVSVANNALRAREKIENIEFDLIILDIMMPGESGLKLTDSLKTNNFKTPILLLSALGNPEDRIKGLEIGASDYLTKPFEPKELLLRMRNLIQKSLSKILNIPNTSRALDVQITRLRNKIENNKKFPTYIQTVRGSGYVLKIE